MATQKVVLIFGTRPEAIKMAPVIQGLRSRPEEFETVVCATAQHRQMLDQVLRIFQIKTDYDLDIMAHDQSLFDVTARALRGLQGVVDQEKPDLILVQGDTTTTFVAALAAFYHRIPVGHVEAGLRTFQKYSPYPEEKNRHLTTVLTDYHFAPTRKAQANLLGEGVPKERIWITGNTVVDALLYIVERHKSTGQGQFWEDYFRREHSVQFDRPVILVTGHRRESFGEGFRNICIALKRIAQGSGVQVVYPVHLNPHVREPVEEILGGTENVALLEPLEYEPFVFLMTRSYLILTDSGGIQEEAPSLGKPVLVMREFTERPEGIEAGAARLVGVEPDAIVEETVKLLKSRSHYQSMARTVNPYGDGRAAARIVQVIHDQAKGRPA